jgi:DNA-binding transcriptional regulator YiaG
MANVVKVLKEEISRISRKEAKSAVNPIGKSHTTLKKVLTDLKRRVAALEKETKRLVAAAKKEKAASPKTVSEETTKARITSKGIRSLRSKLGLSQADFAKLLGATTHSVYLWEKKVGALKLRDKTKAALLSIRGLGAREAQEKLAHGETKRKSGARRTATKTKKAR